MSNELNHEELEQVQGGLASSTGSMNSGGGTLAPPLYPQPRAVRTDEMLGDGGTMSADSPSGGGSTDQAGREPGNGGLASA